MAVANKKILLTGATGLAGSSIIKYILNNCPSTEIRAVYFSTPPFIKNERVDYVHGDLTSQENCTKMVKGCDFAIMAAAYTGGAAFTRSSPWRHIQKNLLMNTQMLEAFQCNGIKRFIFIGSATLYQDFYGSITENGLNLNLEPNEAYQGFGWVVRFIEKLCRFCHDHFGMEAILIRSSNIFGPFAKFNPETSNFIPAIIRKAVDKMDPFQVWGEPDVTRDVIYSEDFARAVVMALDRDDIEFDIFNLGTGVKTTVEDVVEWSLKYSGHVPSKLVYDSKKPTTMKFKALDCSKIKKALDWEPVYSIENGIKKTIEWWQENRNWWKK